MDLTKLPKKKSEKPSSPKNDVFRWTISQSLSVANADDYIGENPDSQSLSVVGLRPLSVQFFESFWFGAN